MQLVALNLLTGELRAGDQVPELLERIVEQVLEHAGLIAEHWGMGDLAGIMAQLRD